MSLNQSNITSNQLDELVRAIVQTVVTEIERPWHSDAHNLPTFAPHGDVSEDDTVKKMATKLWGELGWDVQRDKQNSDGRVFLMRNKYLQRKYLWKGINGQWKYLETPQLGIKKWTDVPTDKLAERADDSPESPNSLDSFENNPAIASTTSTPPASTRTEPEVIENSDDYWIARAIARKLWGQHWYVMESKVNNRGIMYGIKYIPDLRNYMATGKLDSKMNSNFIWKKPDGSWLVLNPRTQSWKVAIPAKPDPIDALHENADEQELLTVTKIAASVWGAGLSLKKSKAGEQGTVYQFSNKSEPNAKSHFLWKTPTGTWKIFDKETKEWNIVSINEMTTTGAVAAVSTPAAFSKRKVKLREGKIQDPTREEMIEYLQYVFSGLLDRPTFNDAVEVAMYWFANFYHGGQSSNLYSVLSTSPYKPGAMERGPAPDSIESDMFSYLAQEFAGKPVTEGDEADAVDSMWAGSDDDLKGYELFSKRKRPAVRKPKQGKKIQASSAKVAGKEIPLKEMTTTGDVSGYNVPSAFARKGGSKKGVEGSAALGFTLTSIGQQEMNRQGDKLLDESNI